MLCNRMTIPNQEAIRNISIILVLLLTASASFGLGMLAQKGIGQTGDMNISTENLTPGLPAESSTTHSIPSGGEVVGSKTAKKFYLPWCSGATALAKTDTIYFATEADAQSDGYVAGGKCPGI
jgi:hypothetical protein